jgi:hypothetical protein
VQADRAVAPPVVDQRRLHVLVRLQLERRLRLWRDLDLDLRHGVVAEDELAQIARRRHRFRRRVAVFARHRRAAAGRVRLAG